MSDAEKVAEPSSHCPSLCSGESENDGGNAPTPNVECNSVEHEEIELENPSWCLIDHPEIWTKSTLFIPKEREEGQEGEEKEEELLKDVISRSERLKSLMNQPKNEITSHPDAKTITDHFCCAICNEIPFPWKEHGDPEIMMADGDDEDEEEEGKPLKETVYLCEQGHVVCRACAQSVELCTFSKPEIFENEEEEDSDSDTDEWYWPDTFVEEEEPMSMDSWGQSFLCLAPIDLSSDVLLAKLIEDTEFACQYFYNWCSFRGRGKALQDHEKNCEFKEFSPEHNAEPSGQETVTECEAPQTPDKANSDDDEDDSAILNYDHFDAISKANDLIGKILSEHLSEIDLSSISSLVLKYHISGLDEHDADNQYDNAENDQYGTLKPEIADEENVSEPGTGHV